MERVDDNKWLDEALADAIGSDRTQPDFDTWKATHPEAVSKFVTRTPQPKRSHAIRSIMMKNLVTKTAVAAAIIIAVLAGIAHFSGPATGVAWGDLAEKVGSIQTFTYRTQQVVSAAGNTIESVVYSSADHGMKTEVRQNGEVTLVSYLLPEQRDMIAVTPQWRKYQQVALDSEEVRQTLGENDPRELVRRFMSMPYQKLGRETINGIEVEGIEVSNPEATASMLGEAVGRLWVDVATDLPVRIEIEGTTQSAGHVKNVTDSIQWNAELAADVFEPSIPNDFIAVDRNNVACLDGPRSHTFHDGSTVSLADGAQIRWVDSPTNRGFEHIAGQVEVTVAKGLGDFLVTTPCGDVKALGTQFTLELADGTTDSGQAVQLLAVEVTEGKVEVSNDQGKVALEAAQDTIVEKDTAPYDFRQDDSLPPRLRERIDSAISAMQAGDATAYVANFNIDYMFRLVTGQEEYDPQQFGGSEGDLQRIRQGFGNVAGPEELAQQFAAMGGIEAHPKLYVRSVRLNEAGNHAEARVLERKDASHVVITTPQWHYFESDWWQIDD